MADARHGCGVLTSRPSWSRPIYPVGEVVTGMAREFSVVIERDSEGYYVASVPALPGCHTQAKSLDDLVNRVREAIEVCLEAGVEPVEGLDFVGVQRIIVAA